MGLILPAREIICTEMYCACGFPDTEAVNYTGETPCNHCGAVDPIFVLGIFNVVKQRDDRQIIICENGERVNTRIDIDYSSCKLDFRFIDLYF